MIVLTCLLIIVTMKTYKSIKINPNLKIHKYDYMRFSTKENPAKCESNTRTKGSVPSFIDIFALFEYTLHRYTKY